MILCQKTLMYNNKPHSISSIFKKDGEYVHWLQKVKEQYRSSQAKAAVRVNNAMIEFYWNLGHDIVDLKAESKWRTGIIKQLSLDMKDEFLGTKGFSTRPLWYIKQGYILYSQHFAKLQLAVAVLQYPQVFSIVPWSHHIMIVAKCKDIDEAIFCLLKDIEGHWSRRNPVIADVLDL